VYSFIYFARAIAANIGIVASSLILPAYGWLWCFIFFGVLTLLSFALLMIFNEKPIPSSTKERPSRRGINGSEASMKEKEGASPVLGGLKMIPEVD
jgi:MFS family permease